jgi:hypothetical protein
VLSLAVMRTRSVERATQMLRTLPLQPSCFERQGRCLVIYDSPLRAVRHVSLHLGWPSTEA